MAQKGRKPGPETVGTILKRTLDRARGSESVGDKMRRHGFFRRWSAIVGLDVAAVAKPERLERGEVLIVRVKDAAWLQELSFKSAEILAAIHSQADGRHVQDIKFQVGNPRDFRD